MSKPALIGIIGLLVLLVAGTLNLWLLPQEDEFVDASVTSPSAVPEGSSEASKDGSTGEKSDGTTSAGSSGRSASEQEPKSQTPASSGDVAGGVTVSGRSEEPTTKAEAGPSFDIVRVDPEGNAVIAGRSAPNARISILEGDTEIGNVTADGRGEWVFIPSERLPSGESVIRLKATDPNGTERESDSAVVLVVPEAGKDIAGNASAEPGTPLAVLVPKDEKGEVSAAKVLQAPETPGADPKAKSSTTRQASSNPEAPKSEPKPEAPKLAEAQATEAKPAGGVVERVAAVPDAAVPEAAVPDAVVADNVSVDVIDYNDQGSVVFSGTSQSGAEVEVYIDNESIGSTVADKQGNWSMTPDAAVSPGTYNLRVDKKAPDGMVLARVQLPFVRARAISALPQDRLVVIQPGNNLWTIALKVYGEGTRYVQIHQANSDQIRDPDMIFPGQIFGLPPVAPTTTN